MRSLLEGSVDAAVVLDQDRRVLYYNRAYEAVCGVRGRELARRVAGGAHCYELFELDICKSACAGCQARDLGRPLRLDEIGATRGDGESLTLIVSAVPVGDYLVESYRDVTAEVRVQRRLKVLLDVERKAKTSLEEQVAERTQALEQAQAQLVLQEKMSALGRLVAGIAHELNNPINFVYGNVDFLRQYVDDLLGLVELVDSRADVPDDVRTAIEQRKQEIEFDYLVGDLHKLLVSIHNGAERTASIVRDLKNFSRTDGGEKQKTDLVAGIETSLNLISPLHRGRITIERDYQGGLPSIYGNAGHIHQVFMNLLTNAAQAIDGEGVIRIALASFDHGGEPWVKVDITDTGSGIPPGQIDQITDPFYTTKPVGEGTGLGLWITQSIVSAHQGSMSCKSELGVGSTFTVLLPCEPRPDASGDQRGGADPG